MIVKTLSIILIDAQKIYTLARSQPPLLLHDKYVIDVTCQ